MSAREKSQVYKHIGMNILIIGSGGREHALAWKIAQSPLCDRLFTAPGNAGTAMLGENIPVKADDFIGIGKIAVEKQIDLVVVGPDDPLGMGIVNYFQGNKTLQHIPILGPPAEGARLESSKAFAKQFMLKHRIPTAAYRSFTAAEQKEAEAYLAVHSLPIVMKADGLAAGKGVSICQSLTEADHFLKEVWEKNKFGEAGSRIVVEEFLTGIELSVFILTDGERYVLLPEAKDYKRIGEGDTGPNTGGMGAVSPVPFADEEFMGKVKNRIIEPTLHGLRADGIPYRGFIFFGLINVDSDPYVIEYNARMGDPETQVVMPRIDSDLLPLLLQAAKGKLEETEIDISADYAAAVIAVSGGYPDAFKNGFPIHGLDELENCTLFFAGVKAEQQELITAGGRVFALVSMAGKLQDALNNAYKQMLTVHFSNMYYRNDIGKDLLPSAAVSKPQKAKSA